MRSKYKGMAGGLLRILPIGVAGWALIGCDAPPDIVPIAPPGIPVPRKSPDVDPAQAVGEVPASAVRAGASTPKEAEPAPAPALPTAKGETKTTAHGVKYETLKEGTGPELKSGETGDFLYEGRLESGKVFDSTKRRNNEPYSSNLSQVITGWKEALPGMKVGEVRKLTVPADAGYGAKGQLPDIPPNATLIFEVELVKVHSD